MVKAKAADFNGPTKARSGFFIFSDEMRPKVMAEIKAQHPEDFKVSMVASKLGELWKTVDAAKKATLEEQAKKEKATYDVEFEAWKKTEDYKKFKIADANQKQKKENNNTKKEAKESGMPSKPMAGYMRFSMSVTAGIIEQMKKEGKKADMKTRSAIVKQKFDALPQAEKDQLDAQYKADQEKYKIDIAAWHQTEAGIKFLASKKKSSEKAANTKKEARRAGKSPRAMKKDSKGPAAKKRKLEDGSVEPQPEESPEENEEEDEEDADESPAESEESPADSDESPEEGDN